MNAENTNDREDEIIVEEVADEAQASEATAAEDGQGEGAEDEVEAYSRTVQRRINRLTEKYRKEERDRQEAERLAQQLLEQNRQMQQRLQQLDTGYLSEYGARIEAQIAGARRAYKEAHEAGDPDKMIEAQEALTRAFADKTRYDLAKSRSGRAATQTQEAPQESMQPVRQQPAAQPAPQPDPKAVSWAEKNPWFGNDEVMTYAAFALDRKLVNEEGFDPQSDEYYSEIDRRMRAEFPHKFSGAKTSGGSRVAPATSSASRSTNSGRRVVKLSPSQIAIANRLGVPLAEYAKYVKE